MNIVDFKCDDDVIDYCHHLHKLGLMYHFDDNPDCILFSIPLTKELHETLRVNHENMWQYCDQDSKKLWSLVPEEVF